MKANWLRKWFDMVTGGEAPADVDAAAHRSALWTAYISCWALYMIAFVVGNTLEYLAVAFLAPALGDYTTPLPHFIGFIDIITRLGPPQIFFAFFIPFFIYSFSLRCRGQRVPFEMLMLVSAVFLSYLFSHVFGGWGSWNFNGLPFLVLALGTLRLVSTKKRWRLLITSSLFLMIAAIVELAIYSFLTPTDFQVGFPNSVISAGFVVMTIFDLIRLPVLILLPIGLMADTPPFILQGHYLRGRQSGQLGRNTIITALVFAAVYVVFKVWANVWLFNSHMQRYISTLGTADIGILTVLYVLAVTALFTQRVSREFIVFLFLVPITMLSIKCVQLVEWSPVSMLLPFTLLLAGIISLTLADTRRFDSAKQHAAGIIAAGSVFLWLWCRFGLPFVSYNFEGLFVFEANYPILAAAIARLALLVYIPTILLFAWWFILPKEIESLVLGKPEPVPQQRNSDGDGANVPGA